MKIKLVDESEVIVKSDPPSPKATEDKEPILKPDVETIEQSKGSSMNVIAIVGLVVVLVVVIIVAVIHYGKKDKE